MGTEKDFENYLKKVTQYAREEGFDTLDETYTEHLRCRFFSREVEIGRGERVRLREMKPGDLEAFYAFPDAEREPALKAFLKDSREESGSYLEAYISAMYPMYDYGIWTAEHVYEKEILGICGIGREKINGISYIDLGYYISPRWRGQGIATECVGIVLDYAENYLELPGIHATVEEKNEVSRRLLRKFGFRIIEAFDHSGEKTFLCRKDFSL